ncbi:Guanylate-binding protein 6 [Branchiostoma belcheri]|nr:Guanylate-binding protein 6 [Branchiostoma belcheri]
MEVEEGYPQPTKFELSLRNKLYIKIDENLSEAEVESLRQAMITDNHIAKGRVENKRPHEMFNMLEADGKIGRKNLGLLKELLKALGKGKLAMEAEDVEKKEEDEEGRIIMDGPIKLTSTRVVNNRRQIYISPEAEKILSSLPPRSVDVVSVVGPMRKGKSHLANLLCKKKSGFPLGDEMVSKTEAFWFWIGPHPVLNDRYLMVIDTEGLGDYYDEEQKDKDMKNLVLATLLSNHLVFNLQGNPDSGFVTNLRLMGDLAERIRVQKDGSDEGQNQFSELWVAVQGAYLKTPQKDGRRLTPDEFLEVLLEHKDGHTIAIRSHNNMTSAVKAFFPRRHLRLIPPPSINPDVLRNLDKVEDSALQADYKDAAGNFTREIWTSGQVKKVNGDDIKTTGLLHIMRYYIDAINDPNAIPSVLGAFEALAEGKCHRASEEQMKTFQKTVEEKVKPLMPTDKETCNKRIQAAVENAVANLSADLEKWDKNGTWKKRLQKDYEIVSPECGELRILQYNSGRHDSTSMIFGRHITAVEAKVKYKFQLRGGSVRHTELNTKRLALLDLNSAKSKDLCETILKKFDLPVRQKVGRGVYNEIGGFNTYAKDMEAVYRAYRQKASGKGPAVEKVLETFRAKETTRRNAIKDTDNKLVEEDRRVKEEQRKKQEAKATAERAAEKERLTRAEATRAAEAQRRAEAEKAAEEAKRRAAEEEARRRADEAEAARQAQRAAEERARRRRMRNGTSLDYETGRPGFDSGSYPNKSKHAPRRCTLGKGT